MILDNRLPENKDERSDHSKKDNYVLRLFITGASPNSVRAIANLKIICDTYLTGGYELKIIDVYQQPEIAACEQLIALPLLIINRHSLERRLIGDMSDTKTILKGLGIEATDL